MEVWQEVGGNPQHAQHVRNVIAHAWIDAASATFDLAKLPDGAVSRDLFAERVLIERKAFMEAQADALLTERQKLIEDGWAEVVIGPQADVQDRLWAMAEAPQEYDDATTAKLQKLADKRGKLEAKLEELDGEDNGANQARSRRFKPSWKRWTTRNSAHQRGERSLCRGDQGGWHSLPSTGPRWTGSAWISHSPDPFDRIGEARTVATVRPEIATTDAPKPPTSDDLKDGQLATTFTQQALAVREAVLKDATTRRRILAIILHEKVRSEALAIRHEANGSTVHADNAEGFTSAALDGIRKRRAELDPLHDKHYVEDHAAYDAFQALSDKKLDALIDLLTVECITAHLQRRTELVWRLASELGVEIRRYWRPDERWLSGYQKIQLAHLIGELRGPVYTRAAELKKKSELVAELAKLFTEAAEGRMEDAKLAAKLNAWLPSNLRDEPKHEPSEQASAA